MRVIDADALIKDIDYSADMGGALGKVVECVKYYAKYMVASAPTIEARKRGKWIKKEKISPEDSDYEFECSLCGWCDVHDDKMIVPYCWHCGAEMSE